MITWKWWRDALKYHKTTCVLLLWKKLLLFLPPFSNQDSFHVSQLGGSIQKCSLWVSLSTKGNEGMVIASAIAFMVTSTMDQFAVIWHHMYWYMIHWLGCWLDSTFLPFCWIVLFKFTTCFTPSLSCIIQKNSPDSVDTGNSRSGCMVMNKPWQRWSYY